MKTFIVTGAGTGLGKELALLLSKKGFHLLLIGRTAGNLLATKKEIETSGGSADLLSFDIRNTSEVNERISQLSNRYEIYGLVNNAGVGHFGPFEQLSNQQIAEMLDTNILGTILMTRAAIPLMLRQGNGHVLNIISTAGLRPKVNESVYVASKFAIRGFTESLQKEYEGSNIHFAAVYMGGMNTPFWDDSTHVKDPSRFRTAREVAEMIIEQMNQDSIIIESKKL